MSNYISYREMINYIDDIQKGDVVYVISDVLELAKVSRENGETFRADVFLQTLLDKAGSSGTVLIPVFNWDFCKGIPFHYQKTPGQTGALGNAALKHPAFIRTKHPIYSFAVAGKLQKFFFEINEMDAFGEGTIFEYLYENCAKALVIGLEALEGLTMVHYIEQAVGVDYRYLKEFHGEYTDWNGKTENKTATMYVRDLDLDPQEEMTELGLWMEKLNIVRTKILNGVPFRTMFLRPVGDILKIDMAFNHSRNIYCFPNRNSDNRKWRRINEN